MQQVRAALPLPRLQVYDLGFPPPPGGGGVVARGIRCFELPFVGLGTRCLKFHEVVFGGRELQVLPFHVQHVGQ